MRVKPRIVRITRMAMIYEEASREIIGAAMMVLNELKPGLDEKLYERAMIIELEHRAHRISVQAAFPVSYRGQLIGNLIPDLIVDDAVIVDPKVFSCFNDTHVAQMIGYLNITHLDLPCSLISRMRTWSSNVCCSLMNLTNSMVLIIMREFLYPCHPSNPWLIR